MNRKIISLVVTIIATVVAVTAAASDHSGPPVRFNNVTTLTPTSTSAKSMLRGGVGVDAVGGEQHSRRHLLTETTTSSSSNDHRYYRDDIPIHKVPFVASAFEANEYVDFSEESFGVCGGGSRGEAVDAQYTKDSTCQQVDKCHLGWTKPGESITYYFNIPEPERDSDDEYTINNDYYFVESWVDVTLRVASLKQGRQVRIVFDQYDDENENDPTAAVSAAAEAVPINGPGLGWQVFQHVTRKHINIPYRNNNDNQQQYQHRVDIIFEDGAVNLCSVSIEFSRQVPFSVPALDFEERYESGPPYNEFIGDSPECSSRSPVDAQFTTDEICIARDNSLCNIGWTEPGEWVVYTFIVTQRDQYYDVWTRIASHSSNRRIRMAITGPWIRNPIQSRDIEFYAPGNGWQSFEDVKFENVYLDQPGLYRLQVTFIDGGVNLCSAQVQYHSN